MAVLLLVLLAGCNVVGAGHVGVKINMTGDNRGVGQIPLVTGYVFYNPLTQRVFEYPTYVQTAVWTRDPHEGSALNEEISFNTKEGLGITGDISLSYQLDALKVPAFYVKFRSDDLTAFTHGFMRNVARDAFNEVGGKYAVEEVYGPKKDEFLRSVREQINAQMAPFGVELQQLGFVGAPRLPSLVTEALNQKLEAQQIALKTQNEVLTAQAEAQKAVAKAKGEAEANRVLTASLTPTLLEWRRLQITEQAVARWNGQRPQVEGSGAGILLQVGGR
jgi:regulator of protease activity HflC (stomatin/prohibitin superfamily)